MNKLHELEGVLLKNGVALKDDKENFRSLFDVLEDLSRQLECGFLSEDDVLDISKMMAEMS